MLRLVVATAGGVGAAVLTGTLPVQTLGGSLVLGGALLVLGLAALIAGVLRHRQGTRGAHRSSLASGHVVQAQGVAFLLWFSGHAAAWAGALILTAGAVLSFFGPRGGVLVATAGLAAAAVFSIAGLAGRGPLAMLGLCWQHHAPSSTVPAMAYPELALALWPRFRDACERDARRARDTGRMSVFTRIQIALDLARSGRAGPRLDLGGRLQASAARESACRLRALALTAWPAMVLVTLLAVFGLLGIPPGFEAQAWPSIASLPSTADSQEGEKTGEVEPSPTQPHGSPDDKASIEPSSDEFRADTSDPAEADPSEPGEPDEGETGGEEPQDSDGAQEASQQGQQGSEQQGEGQQGEGQQGEGQQGEGQQGESQQSEGAQQGSSAGGMSPDSEGGPDSKDGDGQAGGDSPGEAPASEGASGENSPSGEQGGESEAPQPRQASAGAGAGQKPSDAGQEGEGSGSGQGESGAEGAWGLGGASPLGEPIALKPPAPSDVLTLHLPALGSQTVRLEDEASGESDTDAPRAAAGRRGPATPAPDRAESEPNPPQQPLPAWIVRLLRGKGQGQGL